MMSAKANKYLQINTNRSAAAMDLALATGARLGARWLVISEPNVKAVKGPRWYKDNKCDAAIRYLGQRSPVTATGKGDGFVWVRSEEITIYSCYISPNVNIELFEDFIQRLSEVIRRNGSSKIILTGDFNAKSPMWGSSVEDRRGYHLSATLASLNITPLNVEGAPTFIRGNTGSSIDISAVSEGLLQQVTGWEVLYEEYSYSPHRYISFDIKSDNEAKEYAWRFGPINVNRLKAELIRIAKGRELTPNQLVMVLQEAYKQTTPKVRTKQGCIPYWWTNEIQECRMEALRKRRLLTRLRARTNRNGEEERQAEENYTSAKKLLRIPQITQSKRKCWNDLREQIDNKPFGDAYKIVLQSTSTRFPPVRLTPEERDRQIAILFPEDTRKDWNPDRGERPMPFSEGELLRAAGRRLKNGKAPGMDGVPAEVVKVAVKVIGDEILRVLNDLFVQGRFPDKWKVAKLILIEKKVIDVNNRTYRPICLINAIAKLYEQMINTRLQTELEERDSLSPSQHGFRKGRCTVGAINEVLRISKDANRSNPQEWCILTLIDIKNAFNTARWDKIIDALRERRISSQLINVVMSYLSDRKIAYGLRESRNISLGVPQGSILGPTLWNAMYDNIFRMPLPNGVQLVGFADDIAVIGVERNIDRLESNINRAVVTIETWLGNNGLSLAVGKTEAVLLKYGRRNKDVNIVVGGTNVALASQVKYLGVVLDASVCLGPHIRAAAAKAEITISALVRLLPNIGGPGEGKRRVLCSVGNSIMLYGAPVWADVMAVATYRKILQRVQRKMALRTIRAYRTVSYEAATLLARVVPIHLLARESKEVYEGNPPKDALRKRVRERSVEQWQSEWENSIKGAWTRRLIPRIRPWIERKFGVLNYHVTQILTGHGCFQAYMFKIGKDPNGECGTCVGNQDSAEHTAFACRKWQQEREALYTNIGVELSPENIIEQMLRKPQNWDQISTYFTTIMRKKEVEERAGAR